MVKKVSKEKLILGFLQKHKLDLIKQIPGFIDARLDGEELLLLVSNPIDGDLDLSFKGEKLPVRVEVQQVAVSKPTGKAIVVDGDDEFVGPVKKDTISDEDDVVGVVMVPDSEAIGPSSTGAKNQASFEAWKKRHSHVRVK